MPAAITRRDFMDGFACAIVALGRIHFAGSDAAWMAYADRAIDTAHRAPRGGRDHR